MTILTDKKDEVLYRLGKVYATYGMGIPEDSGRIGLDLSRQVITEYPSGQFAETSLFEIGYGYFYMNAFSDALSIFDSYLDKYELGRYAPRVLYLLGKINGIENEAFVLFT